MVPRETALFDAKRPGKVKACCRLGWGGIEWNPGAGATGAPKMALALVLEQAEGRGLNWGKGGGKLLLKFVARPCQPGLWG